MDDMVFWSNDKETLLTIVKQFNVFISSTLKMTLKPYCINRFEKGLPFLGYVIFKDTVRLNKTSKKRFVRKMNLYYSNLENESWSQTQYARHVLPLIAFTRHADSVQLRRQVLCKLEAGWKARTAWFVVAVGTTTLRIAAQLIAITTTRTITTTILASGWSSSLSSKPPMDFGNSEPICLHYPSVGG